MTMRKTMIAMAAALSLGGASLAVAGQMSRGDEAKLPSQRGVKVTIPDRVSASLTADFGVFRGPRTRADELSRVARAGLLRSAQTMQGANLALSRRLPTGDASRRAWVVPAVDAMCWVVQHTRDAASSGCTPVAVAAAGQAFTVSSGSAYRLGQGEVLFSGFMPDGVRDVTLTARDGSRRTVAVRDNFYLSRGADAVSISWQQAGRTHRFRVA
jgi:hypothetical protein